MDARAALHQQAAFAHEHLRLGAVVGTEPAAGHLVLGTVRSGQFRKFIADLMAVGAQVPVAAVEGPRRHQHTGRCEVAGDREVCTRVCRVDVVARPATVWRHVDDPLNVVTTRQLAGLDPCLGLLTAVATCAVCTGAAYPGVTRAVQRMAELRLLGDQESRVVVALGTGQVGHDVDRCRLPGRALWTRRAGRARRALWPRLPTTRRQSDGSSEYQNAQDHTRSHRRPPGQATDNY